MESVSNPSASEPELRDCVAKELNDQTVRMLCVLFISSHIRKL